MRKVKNLSASLSLVCICWLGVLSLTSAFPQQQELPVSPSDGEGLKFYYFPTPDQQMEIVYNDLESLNASNIKPATKTIFLLDGFTSTATSPMNTYTKNNFSGRADVNVILVDWGSLSGAELSIGTPIEMVFSYLVAFANCATAGDRMAEFFQFLRVNGQIEFSDMTVISHSLGCHVAGAAGKRTKALFGERIGRIVGLDPAFQVTPWEQQIRLQIGDAEAVEIYHTNRDGVGDSNLATGDITMFVNGGADQPCKEEDSEIIGKCSSHSYSWQLYNFALNNDTVKACPCKGANCLCKRCSLDCSDPVRIGWYIPSDVRGSFYVSAGPME
ncbi:unnamed protein product [Orchesella dallaii]|uniref:Lipase domain-containing protein n=1 Tax=Orchesella dallaii TaxID=48710 RepID=A0ABP1R2J8_9HEXA